MPLSEGFVFEDVVLPSASDSPASIAHAIEGAVRIAGWTLPGALRLVQTREISRSEDHLPQREWLLQVEHERKPVSGLFCRLRVSTQGDAYGALGCWLPRQPPTSFEAFEVNEPQAERVARGAILFPGGRVMTKSSYQVEGPVARARTSVVLYDGQSEWQVQVDGRGQVVSRRRTERDFTFPGYPLDFTQQFGNIPSSLEVGEGQIAKGFLDSAPALATPGADNCVFPGEDAPSTSQYAQGVVICNNRMLAPEFGDVFYPQTSPRQDGSHSNNANAIDPFGAQRFNLIDVPGLSATSFILAPAMPSSASSPAFAAWRGNSTSLNQIAPAGWAELQAFHSVSKRAGFYRRLNHLGTSALPFYGPKYRLEVSVHQTQTSEGEELNYPNVKATFTGLNNMKLGDLKFFPDGGAPIEISPVDGGNQFFEVVADGSIVAHEFHHHIQAENEWELKQQLGSPGFQDDFRSAAEGMADLFGSFAVRRSVVGLLANPSTPDPCATPAAYPHVNTNALTRGACNDNSYQISYPAKNWYERGAAIYGAGYAYSAPFLRTTQPSSQGFDELVEASALEDMYEAERIFLSSNTIECDLSENGQACNLRRVLEGLYYTILFTDPLSQLGSVNGAAPDTSTVTRRRRHPAITAFASKGMTLAVNNFTTCGPAPAVCTGNGESAQTVALRTLAASSVYRWTEGEPPPSFEIFTPVGTDYQQAPGAAPTTQVNLEASSTLDFTSPTSFALAVPEPANNAPKGSFRFTPNTTQWATLRSLVDLAQGDRLYFRVKLCLADGQTCMVSDQTAVTANTTPFIQIVPASQDPGCSCRQAAAPSALSLGGLGALALATLAVVRRRRPS